MRNTLFASISVPKNTVKRILIRLKLSINDFYQAGKMEVAPGYFFTINTLTGRCRFMIEALDGGELDRDRVPREILAMVLEATQGIPRVAPPTPEELESVNAARFKKRLLTAAA